MLAPPRYLTKISVSLRVSDRGHSQSMPWKSGVAVRLPTRSNSLESEDSLMQICNESMDQPARFQMPKTYQYLQVRVLVHHRIC